MISLLRRLSSYVVNSGWGDSLSPEVLEARRLPCDAHTPHRLDRTLNLWNRKRCRGPSGLLPQNTRWYTWAREFLYVPAGCHRSRRRQRRLHPTQIRCIVLTGANLGRALGIIQRLFEPGTSSLLMGSAFRPTEPSSITRIRSGKAFSVIRLMRMERWAKKRSSLPQKTVRQTDWWFRRMEPFLDERGRRLFAANEAL